MVRKLMAMAVILVVAAGTAAAQTKEEEKEAKNAAKEKIKEFKTTLKSGKTETDIVSALEGFADMQHALILTELSKWLRHPSSEVKREAARQIAKYELDPKAADIMLKAAGKEKDEDNAIKFFEVFGEIKHRKYAKPLTRYFKHKIVNVAQAAIEAAGTIGSRDSISPLIALLKELDSIQDDPNTPGGPSMPGPGVPAGGGGNNEQLQRKRQLLSVVQQALKDITDERFNKPRDWEKWWQKNAKKFKEKEQ